MGRRPRYGDWQLYRRLFREARPFTPGLLALFFLSLLAAPLALLLPLPVKIVVDHVLEPIKEMPPILDAVIHDAIQGTPSTLLVFSAAAIVVLSFLVQLQDMSAWLLRTWIGRRLVLDFRSKLFQHLQRLSLSFHDRKGTADSVYRLQFDAPAIEGVMLQGAIPFATSVVKVLVLVYVVARLDIVLAGVALLGGPAFFAVTELFRRRLRRRWTEVREQESLAMAVAQEVLASVRVVKAFGQEAREGGRYWKRERAGVRATMRATWVHGIFDVVIVTAQGFAGAAILYLGALHVQEGVITLGELLLVLAYLAQLMQPMMDAGTRIAELQKSLASAGRAFDLLDEAPETKERPGAGSLARAQGAFELRNMSFAYGSGDALFSDVSLDVPAGARVGITGETGSGKSTLLGLLPRFYDPTAGAILLDGRDLRDIRLADLRRQFAMVLQDSVLFSTTIRENIAYGRPDATEAEIVQAAKDAAAHDFIAAKPDGYDTAVGERGATLSGGERQRIAIARAFLCDAPVLILDEPTSALDTDTEADVMDAVERLMEGRTTFIIAHRLSTLESCDLRLQVGDGRVLTVPKRTS